MEKKRGEKLSLLDRIAGVIRGQGGVVVQLLPLPHAAVTDCVQVGPQKRNHIKKEKSGFC